MLPFRSFSLRLAVLFALCVGLVLPAHAAAPGTGAPSRAAGSPSSHHAIGSIVGWGGNDYGELNAPAGLKNVTAIAAGNDSTLALKSDGTVVAWGDDDDYQTDVPATLFGATSIGEGYSYSLALTTQENLSGQGSTISPTVLTSFTGTVATFTDTDPNTPDTAFFATIDWGDTTTSAGTVTGSSGSYSVAGTHTYPLPGQYTTTVTITGPGGPLVLTGTANTSALSTTTALQSSANPSVYGQSVTLTASVTGPGGTPVLVGSVDFVDTTTSTDLGTVAVNASTGQASVSTSALSVGGHNITTTYSNTGGVYGGSNNSLTQTANQAGTRTTLTLPAPTPDDTQTFEVSATVAPVSPGAGTPSGTVTFTVNGTPQDAPLTNGTASLTVGPFTPGSVTISATYDGDTNFNTSSASQQSQSVTAGPATQLSVSAPGTATAGTAINASVTAQDAQGYTVTGYMGTVHFSSTDGAASLPGDYTFTAGDRGVHSFSVTLNTGGSQTVTATDTVTSAVTGTSSSIQVTTLNPAPHLSTVTLTYAFLGSPTQTLQITSTGFLPTSVVHWNGTALTTTYVDATHLSAQIPDALLTAQAAAPVTVVNPAPGGGTSNTVIYTVKVRIASLHLSKGKVKGGTTITGTVTLMLAAPPNGQNIGVSCDDPAHVLLPSVKPNVKGGQTSVTFTIKTSKVTSQVTVTITAVAGGTKHETVILTP